MKRPTEVNILGVTYQVQYLDNPSLVDIHKRQSLWGQIDCWTRTIRIYDSGRPTEDIWQTLLHEVFHGIASHLHLKPLEGNDAEDLIDVLALSLVDVFIRNGWLRLTGDE